VEAKSEDNEVHADKDEDDDDEEDDDSAAHEEL
jgi:hypothetical protein